MTIALALVFSSIYIIEKKNKKEVKSVLFASLMFWGASIMWAVDGIFSVLEGKPFFDISKEDAFLGFIIIAAGLLLFAFSTIINKQKNAMRLLKA